MKTIKDENIRETIVNYDGHTYLRRDNEGIVSWKIQAGKNGDERWWVSLMKEEERNLEEKFEVG